MLRYSYLCLSKFPRNDNRVELVPRFQVKVLKGCTPSGGVEKGKCFKAVLQGPAQEEEEKIFSCFFSYPSLNRKGINWWRASVLNIIFDLGGVVFTWDPGAIIARLFHEPEKRSLIRDEVFRHPDWREMDRGLLSYAEATERAVARTGLAREEIKALFRWVPLSLVGIPETVALMRELKNKGHVLYYLSNMHRPAMEYLERVYTLWNLFQGGVFSCRVHWVKPEEEIYLALLEQEDLSPDRAVFIDDTPANLLPAEGLGLKTVLFQGAASCRERLLAWERRLEG